MVLITEDTARVMEEQDIYLVPTFCPYDDIINLNEESLKEDASVPAEVGSD